jgi:hypothetical protein
MNKTFMVTTLMFVFFAVFFGSKVLAQTDTSTPSPTPSGVVPTGAPRTGLGGMAGFAK